MLGLVKDWWPLVTILATVYGWYRSYKSAAGAKIAAKAANDRAEEALNVAANLSHAVRMHLAGQSEREQAERDAGQIVDTWLYELKQHLGSGKEKLPLRFAIDSLAKEVAIERLRAEKEKHGIVMLTRAPNSSHATIVARRPPIVGGGLHYSHGRQR
jgi:hypothetical protein